MKKSLSICILAYCQMFTFAYSSAVALAKVDSALLPVIPQPTEWKPAEGVCDLATAKVEVSVNAESGLGEEGYSMKIAPDGITAVAGGETGRVWARQTLAQLKVPRARRL